MANVPLSPTRTTRRGSGAAHAFKSERRRSRRRRLCASDHSKACNAIGIPIAAGVLYPTFGILLSPIVGALAMSLSSVSVILNALRLRALKL
jgi:hypothetical protein